METKKIIIGAVALLILVGAAVAAYFFLPASANDKYADAILPRDFSGQTVEPVAIPMKGFTFMVPSAPTSTATSTNVVETELNLVWPSATRNYPMGRFTSAGENGTLAALDDFAAQGPSGRLVVPIAVAMSGGLPMYYLAILESAGSSYRHIASLPLDEAISIRDIQFSNSEVRVQYLTHARGQDMTALPTESTTAIFDVDRATIVQRGRQPRFEVVEVVKTFSGQYQWLETILADGTVIEPVIPGEFTLLFDGRRIRLDTDCNTGTADFTTSTSSAVSVGDITATDRFCTSDQEDEYFAMVTEFTEYADLDTGGYSFTLAGGGEMVFVTENFERSSTQTESATTTPSDDEST